MQHLPFLFNWSVNFLSLELWKHNVSLVVWNCFSTGSKPQQREAKAVAMLALKLLSSQFLELHPSFTEKVASVMADHLLVSQKVGLFSSTEGSEGKLHAFRDLSSLMFCCVHIIGPCHLAIKLCAAVPLSDG
jgi:hypothetical protein